MSKHANEIMNQLSLIQALTGNIPGQGANGNGGQGALADSGSGAILFSSLLSQQLPQAPAGILAGVPETIAGAPETVAGAPEDGSPDGASALLQVTAGAAAGQSLLVKAENNASAAGEPRLNNGVAVGVEGGVAGQVLFGLVDRAVTEAARAAENSPVLAAVLADDGSTSFAAGPNDQTIPAPFQEISPVTEMDADPGETAASDDVAGIIIGRLPAQASATAVFASGLVSGRERASTVNPTPVSEIDMAIAIAPDGESVVAAAKGFGAPGTADAPVAPPTATARGEAAPLEALKAFKADGDNQPRQHLVQKSSGDAQANFAGNAGGSDDLDSNGQSNDQQSGARNTGRGAKGLGIGGGDGDFSGPGRGIKTSAGVSRAKSGAVANLPSAAGSSGPPQSHMTSFRAMENSMALSAGLILPFDSGAIIDPATGTPTSLSAQSLAVGIQAPQAGTSVAGPAGSAASFAHSPNFVARQVGLQITRAIADGQNEFTIRLNPPELGRIEVRLEFSADGGVKAALSAEKPETLNLLQRDAAALERALNDAGVKTDSGSLNFSLQQGETQAGEDSDASAGGLSGAGDEAAEDHSLEPEIEITEQVIQQMVADGAVDIRV